jgi:toxin-antitoxin system PIN domain toxin
VLLDANVLLYATDESSPRHAAAAEWMAGAFEGDRRIAIPWQTIGAFLRIATHPRVFTRPLQAEQALDVMDGWLAAPHVWVPAASATTVRILQGLIRSHHLGGNAVPDAQLAAIAIEHGIPLVSADSDFARFADVDWINPVS